MSARILRGSVAPIASIMLLFVFGVSFLHAQDKPKPKKDDGFVNVPASIDKGVRWLIKAQSIDGSWNNGNQRPEVAGSTALATYTLLKCGVEPNHPAVQKGLAYVEAHIKDRVYEMSILMMLYAALPKEMRPAKKVKERTKFLLRCFNDKAWGYPGNHGGQNFEAWSDLSNTQYALLGISSAAKCGEDIPGRVWKAAAEYVMTLQKDYGSFSYRKGQNASLSMSVAGTASLELCRRQLTKYKGVRGLLRKINVRLTRAEHWFEKNWYLEQNRRYGKKTEDDKRWTYYYLYGLERVGSFLKVDRYANRDWYGEGARLIIGRQSKDGHWGTAYGESDINTSFALLFLSRGSSTTDSARSRIRGEEKKPITEAVEIRSNGENPTTFWVQRAHGKGRELIASGASIYKVAYECDGKVLGEVTADTSRFLLKHEFEKNADHKVTAKVTFIDEEGEVLETLVSNGIVVPVDNVLTEEAKSVIADAGKNLLIKNVATVTASSQEPNYGPKRCTDSNGTTGWLCKTGDKAPTLRVRLSRQQNASCIKLTPSFGGKERKRYDRPKDIEVVINGKKKINLTLPDVTDRRHVIKFSNTRVQRFRIRVKSVYKGSDKRGLLGYSEVELFKKP